MIKSYLILHHHLGQSLIEARNKSFENFIAKCVSDPFNVELLLCNFGLPEFARYPNQQYRHTKTISTNFRSLFDIMPIFCLSIILSRHHCRIHNVSVIEHSDLDELKDLSVHAKILPLSGNLKRIYC